MTSLNQFEDNIEDENGREIKAFRMDNTKRANQIPDMRKYVGLGSCDCCDRFFVCGDKIFIVEETRLQSTIENIKTKYSYLNSTDKRDVVIKLIMQENYVKMYGSMLVLCCLAKKCGEAAKLVSGKKHHFWLVVEQIEDEESNVYFDHLKSNLLSDLRSKLTKKVIDKVEIIPSHILPAKLSGNATTS